MPGRASMTSWMDAAPPVWPAADKVRNTDLVSFRVKVSGDLCHRSGYLQNHAVKKLVFTRSLSRVIRLAPGAYSLTVFVGAEFGRKDVDYAVELIADQTVTLHVPWRTPFRARTVGITGFIVIDFTLYWKKPS